MDGRHNIINSMTAASQYYDWELSVFFKELCLGSKFIVVPKE